MELIKRCEAYTDGYRAYCLEAYENNVTYFVPTNPARIDAGWFARTKDWYDKKEQGLIAGQPRSFHYWAVDGDAFIGEFQLRTESTPQVLCGIGHIGYAVRVSRQGRGYGMEILRHGLRLAKEAHGMQRVLLNINEQNAASIHLCEKCGGQLMDTIDAYNQAEGQHRMRRYWINLNNT